MMDNSKNVINFNITQLFFNLMLDLLIFFYKIKTRHNVSINGFFKF